MPVGPVTAAETDIGQRLLRSVQSDAGIAARLFGAIEGFVGAVDKFQNVLAQFKAA